MQCINNFIPLHRRFGHKGFGKPIPNGKIRISPFFFNNPTTNTALVKLKKWDHFTELAWDRPQSQNTLKQL